MTASRSHRISDLVGVRISGGSDEFPNFATKQTVALGALDPQRIVTLLRVADAAAFFTREKPRSGAAGPNVRTWRVRFSMAAARVCWPFRSHCRTSRLRC
jgi:hypothetical protein